MKKFLTIIGVMGIIVFLFYIFIPKEKLEELKLPIINQKGERDYDGGSNMTLVTTTNRGNYRDGYFYIRESSGSNKTFANIMYYDYDTKKEVYLCNKPNCNHTENTCNSHLEFSETNELFYYNNYLYFINTQISDSIVYENLDGTTSGGSEKSPTTIYRMNLDGTNKIKLFTVPSGTTMSMPYIIKGDTMYSFLENYEIKNNSSIVTSKKLIAINLNTGKYETIIDGTDKSFLGVYQDKILLRKVDYKEDPNKFKNDDKGYFKNLENSTVKIVLLDLSNKKEKNIYEDTYQNLKILEVYKDGIYFIGKDSKNLEYINIDTTKKETIKELSDTGVTISNIIDDKILLHYRKLQKAEYIDLKSKNTTSFTLTDNNHNLVEILSSNNDYYFVGIETIYGDDYTTWAGTTSKRVLGTNYALIKKADYWASRPNYIKMTNAK